MHHGICYKDANHQVFNLMDQLIRTQLDDTNDISDGPNQKIFNDYCLKKTTIDIDWKQMRCMPDCYFGKLFCDAKYEWKQLEIIFDLFPNMEQLRLMNMDLSASVLDNMLTHLGTAKAKIKCICMELISSSALSASSAVNKYRKSFKGLNFNLYDGNGDISDNNEVNDDEHSDDIFGDMMNNSDHTE
eukprot:535604_1